VVLAKKKDGTYRLCLDFRTLNAETITAPFPLPHINSLFERLRGSRFFCKLDLSSGFLQIPMSQDSCAYTAFSTQDGHWEFVRMPFGLRNAPLHFQSVMTDVLGPILHRGAEGYMDDCILHAATIEELGVLLQNALELFRSKGLKLNKKKCLFGVSSLEFLGHHISSKGIGISEGRKEALRNLPTPSTVRQLRQFLGAWNYVRDHLENFATVAAPLFGMLSGKKPKKNQPLVWTPACLAALSSLRSLIDNLQLLHFADPRIPLVLETDASQSGIGAVLFHEDNGSKKVVAIVSKAFTGPSMRWMVSEKESFAIYHSIMKLRHFLLGRSFTVRTDCRNLLFTDSQVVKIQRWNLRLQEFDFKIEHISGAQNEVADSLSRLNVISDDVRKLFKEVHGGLCGHHGIGRTVRMLKSLGHEWNGMESDVKDLIKDCTICAKMKNAATPFTAVPGSIMSCRPFDSISMDLLGPFVEGHY
jgi:hypothetical protein